MSLRREYAAGDTRIGPDDADVALRLAPVLVLVPALDKAAPVEADGVYISDSERGGAMARVSLATLAELVASLIGHGGPPPPPPPPPPPVGALAWNGELVMWDGEPVAFVE